MLFAQGALFLLHTPLIAILPRSVVASSDLFGSVWLTVLSFEGLLFTISVAFILLAMAKERIELWHRTAALLDPLTGIANRRAFLQEAEALAERHRAAPKPASLLLLDLDHFKSVNDRFGHALGDRVLQLFTATAKDALRDTDLFGRFGGEEFAILLPDTNSERAVTVAERINTAFAKAAREVDGKPAEGTVSIGIALCDGPVLDVPSLLAQADRALYLAKESGRNRVEMASLESFLKRAGAPPAAAQTAA
jgi:diguanylate cyclase (GGDEF)-like protein